MLCKARVSHKSRVSHKAAMPGEKEGASEENKQALGSREPLPRTWHDSTCHRGPLSHWAVGSGLAVHLGTAHGPTHLQLWPLHAKVGEGGGRPLESIVQTPISAGGAGAPQCYQRAARGHGFGHLGPVAGQSAAQPLSHVLGLAETPCTPLPPEPYTKMAGTHLGARQSLPCTVTLTVAVAWSSGCSAL